MELETSRLWVRDLTEDDAPSLHAVLSDAEVMRFLEPPFTPAQTRNFIRSAGLSNPPPVYAVTEKPSREVIGHLIWHPWGEGAMELGWVLRRDRWGRGYASELTEALLARADRDVVLECSPKQAATKRIAARFAFVRAGMNGELEVYRLKKQEGLPPVDPVIPSG